MNPVRWSLFLCVVLLGTGCSGGGKQSVSGKVTLDGEVVPEGKIDFIPTDGKANTASGIIKDGRYEATVPAGSFLVKIYSSKVVGKKPRYNTKDSPVDDIVVERIPAKFNKDSKLVRDIDGKSSEVDFDLKTKD